MLVNLLCLSRNSVRQIYQFLDDKSAMKMREVSKSMKTNVDTLIVGARKIYITLLIFEKNETAREMIDIGFRFDDLPKYSMWENFCLSAFQKSDFTFAKEQHSDMLAITLSADAMKQFFDDLKPYIAHIEVLSLTISIPEPEIVRHCLKFLEGKVIQEVRIGHWTAEMNDFSIYMRLIKQFKPASVNFCARVVTEESVKFVLKIADIVKKLAIFVGTECQAENASILHSISFIREILKQNCDELHISLFADVCLPSTNIEKIIKLLHNAGKKVHLCTWTRAPPMDVQIGIYSVKTHDYTALRRNVVIKHFELMKLL